MSIQSKGLAIAVAAASAACSAAAANAETSVALLAQSPVALTACQIEFRFGGNGPYMPNIPLVTGLQVRFHNQRQVEANEVDLRLQYNGRETTIVDHGSFASSTTIARDYSAFDDSVYFGATPDHCSVVSVHYVDGSIWNEKGSVPGIPIAKTP